MAVVTPPAFLQDGSHTAQQVRQLLAATFGAPVQTFTGGIQATDGGGAHGVIGTGLAVSEKSGTPDMSVDVAVGSAVITGTSSLAQGVYAFTNDAVTNLTVATADGSNDRKDLVVAQVRDDDEDAGGTNDARLTVVTGTPAASPADPTVPAGASVLARILVAAASTSVTDSDITDLRMRANAVGGIQVCTSTTRPSGVSLYSGLMIWETDKNRQHVYDGTNFVIVAGDWPQINVTRETNQSITTSTTTTVAFGTSETEVTDTDGFKGASADIVTIPVGLGGDYLVTGHIVYPTNGTGVRRLRVLVGSNSSVSGELPEFGATVTASGSTFGRVTTSKLVRLEAGATVELSTWQNSGGSLNANPMSLTLHMVRHVPTLT